MKYLTHSLKGTFGYIKKQTLFEIIKTIILFAMALGIFFIGYFTLGTKKSLWSVIAVLALLPASKSLVGAIMFLRYKSITEDLYKRLQNAAGNLPALYEMVFTTTDKSYFVKSLVYGMGSVCMLSDCKSSDVKKIEEHIIDVLKKGGHKDLSIKVYNKENDYLNRVETLKEHFEDKSNANATPIFDTLKAVAL